MKDERCITAMKVLMMMMIVMMIDNDDDENDDTCSTKESHGLMQLMV